MTLDELRQEILKQSYVDTTVIRWSKLPDEPIEQKAQAIVEIPIDDLMDIIELFIANQVREELTNLKIARLNLDKITTDHADGYQMAIDDMNRHIDNRIKELEESK